VVGVDEVLPARELEDDGPSHDRDVVKNIIRRPDA